MIIIKNPARARPLSSNVKRLMKMARESPRNPNVEVIERPFTDRDLAYCDLQGSIFMAAVDRGIPMAEFAPLYMTSQFAGVVDYSFSRAGGLEDDDLANYLRIPMLLKSPVTIVDTVVWLSQIAGDLFSGENASLAIVNALNRSPDVNAAPAGGSAPGVPDKSQAVPDAAAPNIEQLADEYEYAYWLGFIYRCECHMHDESSRMVFGAFSEPFMRDFYRNLQTGDDIALAECAPEICRQLDALLVGKLWK